MPLTPFAGLSMTLHILVIAFSTVIRFILPKRITLKSFAFTVPRKVITFVSLFLVLSIFSIIILGALGILYVSATDEHSSILLGEEIWKSVDYALIAEKFNSISTLVSGYFDTIADSKIAEAFKE